MEKVHVRGAQTCRRRIAPHSIRSKTAPNNFTASNHTDSPFPSDTRRHPHSLKSHNPDFWGETRRDPSFHQHPRTTRTPRAL